jgi:hypothetical protein
MKLPEVKPSGYQYYLICFDPSVARSTSPFGLRGIHLAIHPAVLPLGSLAKGDKKPKTRHF